MRKPTNEELIADVLAIHFEVQQRVQDKRRPLTPLQIHVLADSTTSLKRFLIAWQTEAASKREVKGTRQGSRVRPIRKDH